MKTEYEVKRTTYQIHMKSGASEKHPKTLRVDHHVERDWSRPEPGKPIITEYICLDHKGYARKKAIAWWKEYSSEPIPSEIDNKNVERAYWMAVYGALKKTTQIVVKEVNDFPSVVGRKLGDLPSEEEICNYLLPNK